MITVRLKGIVVNELYDIEFSDDYVYIITEGHSGTGIKGEDLVCAGVSSLTQSYIVAVSRVLKIRQDVAQRDGFLESAVAVGRLTGESLSMLKAVIGMVVAGLREIQAVSPGSIEIIYE